MRLRDVAALVDGELAGNSDAEIKGLAKIEEAGPGDITFLANMRYKKFVGTTGASAILVTRGTTLDEITLRTIPLPVIYVEDPYASFQRLAEKFYTPRAPLPSGVHPTAIIAATTRTGKDVAVGPNVVVGEHCTIGSHVALHAGVILGNNITIDSHSILYPNVVIHDGCTIGMHVIIHSSTTIGSDGFGFTQLDDGSYEKITQRGIVAIEDDVEIGANCTIDRATLGETRIKKGAKLDNLIHVAHNVTIGEDTVIAAQTGVSGSTKIGKNCQIAGQVGFSGHLTIADRTIVGAKSGVPKSIEPAGQTYFGYPAFPINETLRIQAATRALPALLIEIRQLEKRIEELEKILQHHHTPEDKQ
jgi:UDP-3-O-[3-hydroxymyristoyl] glucosamine N-acyltransferase